MNNKNYLLGCDIGSSSVKAALIETDTGKCVGKAFSPQQELTIYSKEKGWAEQAPETWWKHLKIAVKEILQDQEVDKTAVSAIGISYQMHGLVAVDKNRKVLRPSIIWCDSRAADIGDKAFTEIGRQVCLQRFLNSPGNFTASKLKWVMQNESDIYEKIDKIMLPGDYIAMKMTGEVSTTTSGLSEAILWDYSQNSTADLLLEHYKIPKQIIPKYHSSFHKMGELTGNAAEELGLKKGTKVTYRAGDQPNNALSLNVLEPGEVAATAGTSGVIYGIADQPVYDDLSRVNTFVHVNHQISNPRYGVLLCVNGTGILYSWLKNKLILDESITYNQMNHLAEQVPVGSDGITILPFGNGAERILENRNTGASVHSLQFNRHGAGHIIRAAQEGIVFALNYGFEIMNGMGIECDIVKAANTNMFQSKLFREIFVNTTGAVLEIYETDGAEGAARGAGIGAGLYSSAEEAFDGLTRIKLIEPDTKLSSQYPEFYMKWVEKLKSESK